MAPSVTRSAALLLKTYSALEMHNAFRRYHQGYPDVQRVPLPVQPRVQHLQDTLLPVERVMPEVRAWFLRIEHLIAQRAAPPSTGRSLLCFPGRTYFYRKHALAIPLHGRANDAQRILFMNVPDSCNSSLAI